MINRCEICGFNSEAGLVITELGKMCVACVANHDHCDHCGDLFLRGLMSGFGSYIYCPECHDEFICFCESCEEEFRREGADENGYCPDCQGSPSDIHQWDYQPRYVFKGKGPLYFGIELEIEFRDQSPSILIDAACDPYFFLKHDGSISDGAEVVSHPASFKWINDNFASTWGKVLQVKEKGMRSYTTATCGIHIHMSKAAFSKLHLYKFIRFFRENADFITKVSQRTDKNLTQWSAVSSDESIFHQVKQGSTDRRYTAVNLMPPKTVEVRIFRGNLQESGFRKNLEFCKALFDFTAKSSCSGLTAVHFFKFVANNKKQFPRLVNFLLKLEIAKMKRKPTINGVHRKFPSEKKKGEWSVDENSNVKEWERRIPEEISQDEREPMRVAPPCPPHPWGMSTPLHRSGAEWETL